MKVTVDVFSTDLPNAAERLCKLMDEIQNIVEGRRLQENPSAIHHICIQLLKDSALDTYRLATTSAVEDNNNTLTKEIINDGMRKVIELVMPLNGRQTQARYMRRFIGKPSSMTVAAFVARLQVLNKYLRHLPGTHRTSMAEDEIVEIVIAAIPVELGAFSLGFQIRIKLVSRPQA